MGKDGFVFGLRAEMAENTFLDSFVCARVATISFVTLLSLLRVGYTPRLLRSCFFSSSFISSDVLLGVSRLRCSFVLDSPLSPLRVSSPSIRSNHTPDTMTGSELYCTLNSSSNLVPCRCQRVIASLAFLRGEVGGSFTLLSFARYSVRLGFFARKHLFSPIAPSGSSIL